MRPVRRSRSGLDDPRIPSEVQVGPGNGIDYESVISVDNIATIDADALGDVVGYLNAEQESQLTYSVLYAFDLSE